MILLISNSDFASEISSLNDWYLSYIGVLVGIVIAVVGFVGFTEYKLSQREIKKVERDTAELVNQKTKVVKHTLVPTTINGWQQVECKESSITAMNGIDILQLKVKLKGPEIQSNTILMDAFSAYDIDGNYPVYIEETNKWVTATRDEGAWTVVTPADTKNKTLSIDLTWIKSN